MIFCLFQRVEDLSINAHASNETPSLKDACFTKRSPHKFNRTDEAKYTVNYALNCPNCFDDTKPLKGPEAILRIRAALLTKENTPFSLVIENYSPALVAPR